MNNKKMNTLTKLIKSKNLEKLINDMGLLNNNIIITPPKPYHEKLKEQGCKPMDFDV